MSKKKVNNMDNIDKLIENTFTRLKDIIDANTIIGKTIKSGDNVSIIPISKVSVGIITGGGQLPIKRKDINNIGNTTGFNIIPIGFLCISGENINYISTALENNSTGKLIDVFAIMYDKFFKNDGENNEI